VLLEDVLRQADSFAQPPCAAHSSVGNIFPVTGRPSRTGVLLCQAVDCPSTSGPVIRYTVAACGRRSHVGGGAENAAPPRGRQSRPEVGGPVFPTGQPHEAAPPVPDGGRRPEGG